MGNVPDQPSWIAGSPALAVECADTGQNEEDLAVKIQELLAAGAAGKGDVASIDVEQVQEHKLK